MNRVRVYGNKKQIGDDYYAVAYKDYIDGELVGEGEEEFSRDRLVTVMNRTLARVCCWYGRIRKDNKRFFESEGFINAAGAVADIQKIYQTKYSGAAAVQIRKR